VYAAALFFTLTVGVVPINDLRDIYADRRMGLKTMPVVVGPKTTIQIALAIVTSALVVSVLSYGWLGFNVAFPVLVGISSLLLAFSLVKISRNWNDPAYIEMIKKRILWPVNILMQLSILVGLIS
jgi:4-hydroxybenzoate polyprenyltransferase